MPEITAPLAGIVSSTRKTWAESGWTTASAARQASTKTRSLMPASWPVLRRPPRVFARAVASRPGNSAPEPVDEEVGSPAGELQKSFEGAVQFDDQEDRRGDGKGRRRDRHDDRAVGLDVQAEAAEDQRGTGQHDGQH